MQQLRNPNAFFEKAIEMGAVGGKRFGRDVPRPPGPAYKTLEPADRIELIMGMAAGLLLLGGFAAVALG